MIDAAIGWESVAVLSHTTSHNSLAVRHVREPEINYAQWSPDILPGVGGWVVYVYLRST